MAQPADTIGSWDSTQLSKVVRELIVQNLPDHLGGLTVDDLIVAGSLVVQGNVTYSTRASFFTVGTSGQPPFTNSWVNFGAPYKNVAFIKTEDGWVRPVGAAKSGGIASSMFTLPPGFRPSATQRFAVGGNGLVGLVDITSAGLVIPQSPATNALVNLDGIQFKAA